MDAETLNRLKEGDVTALDKLREKLEQENKTLKEGYTALMEENRQLKDSLLTQTLRQIVADEFERRFPQGGGNSGHRTNVEEAIDRLVANRIDTMLGGGNQPNLTAEEIRKMVAEEVEKGNKNKASPTEIVDNIVGLLTAADQVKQRLNIDQGGGRYLPQMAGGLRSDILKILLEDERERLRMQYEHESQTERNKHLGVLASSVRDNLEDIIAASRDMVKEHRESRNEKGEEEPQSEPEEGYQVKCSLCGEISMFSEKPAGIFECPKCHGKLRLQDKPQKPLPQGPQGVGSTLEI